MRRTLLWSVLLIVVSIFLGLMLVGSGYAQPSGISRPKITGIDHVTFYTTDSNANFRFWNVLGIGTAGPIESGQTVRFVIGRRQWVRSEERRVGEEGRCERRE